MNRREFTAAMLAAGAAIPLGITRAAGQTKGGTLNTIIQPEPPILVTAFNQQQPTLTLGGKIYESLLKYGADLKPMPGMAQSWEISPDGLTYTFKLFPGITFHDGKPMTSEDVVFSCMKVLTETHPRARQNFARVASAEAPDPLTVVFKLKQPFAPFLGCFDCTSAPIVPKHIYEGTEFRKNPMNDKAIGTGPFKLKEWVRGSHVQLVRHDGYYRKDEPYLDEIIYRIIPDGASRALALENGTVQLVQWSDIEFFDVQRFKTQKNLEFTTKGYEYFAPHQWLEMNNRVAPMNDKRFRQAIMHLIDRDAMNKRIYFGNAKVATGPISSKTRFYDGKVKRYEFSVEKATKLLDEMGLKPGANGKRAEIKYLVPPYGEVYQRAGELPDEERFGLIAQMRRAAVSIPSNVAEGHAFRTRPRAYRRHVRIALGSIAELDTQVEFASRLDMLKQSSLDELHAKLERAGKLLHGLLRALRAIKEDTRKG